MTDKVSSGPHNTNQNVLALSHFNQINKQSFHFVYWIRNKYYHIAQSILLLALKAHIVKEQSKPG